MASPKALKLRTDCISAEVDAKVLAFVRKVSPCHFVVQHNADKESDAPHWHAIMWTQRDAQSVRVHLLKAVPELKRKYSLGAVGDSREDYEAYERYMCHGDCEGDTVSIVSAQAAVHHPAGAYTQAWAQEQNRKFYQVQRAFVREKKHKKLPVIEKILEECKARNATGVVAIGQVIVDLYTKEHRMMNVYNMKSQLRTAMCVMGGTRAKRTVLDEITQGLVEPENNIYPMSSTVGDERAYSDPLEPDIHGSGTVCSGSGSDSSADGDQCVEASSDEEGCASCGEAHHGGSEAPQDSYDSGEEDGNLIHPSLSARPSEVRRRWREQSRSVLRCPRRVSTAHLPVQEDRKQDSSCDSRSETAEGESGHCCHPVSEDGTVHRGLWRVPTVPQRLYFHTEAVSAAVSHGSDASS